MQSKLEQARFNMVEQQIKPWNVHDSAVLNAIRDIRREDFVPAEHTALAFADISIPLSSGRVMLEPKIVAQMLQTLHVDRCHRVLMVGVGTGYVAALLSKLAHEVICTSKSATDIETAKRNVAMAGIGNVYFEQGDALAGWNQAGELDRIFIRSAIPEIPHLLCEQLSEQGRCVAIVGVGKIMELICYQKQQGTIVETSVLDTATSLMDKKNTKLEFIF